VTFVRHDDTTSAINKDALSAYKFNKLLLIWHVLLMVV
jgi:hypothetical protein